MHYNLMQMYIELFYTFEGERTRGELASQKLTIAICNIFAQKTANYILHALVNLVNQAQHCFPHHLMHLCSQLLWRKAQIEH